MAKVPTEASFKELADSVELPQFEEPRDVFRLKANGNFVEGTFYMKEGDVQEVTSLSSAVVRALQSGTLEMLP